jgi:hypothetical protein
MVPDEVVVKNRGQAGGVPARAFCVQQVLPQALEQCLVAAGPDLQEVISQLRAHQRSRDGLRVLEVQEPGLGERIDGDDGGAVFLGLLQGAEHARMVRARVLARHEDEGRRLQILEADRPLADAYGLHQRRPGGLVAHV